MRGRAGLAALAVSLVLAGCGRDDPKQYTCAEIRQDPEKREAVADAVATALVEDEIVAGYTLQSIDRIAREFTENACRRLKPQGKPYVDLVEQLQARQARQATRSRLRQREGP